MVDKLTQLNKRLKDVKDKFDALKKSGIDEEILVIYLRTKTGLSKKDIHSMLKHQQEFYDKLVRTEVVKSLDK